MNKKSTYDQAIAERHAVANELRNKGVTFHGVGVTGSKDEGYAVSVSLPAKEKGNDNIPLDSNGVPVRTRFSASDNPVSAQRP